MELAPIAVIQQFQFHTGDSKCRFLQPPGIRVMFARQTLP
jgi:hypothetical protein